MNEWQPISTAPKNETRIEAMMSDGTIYKDCHYAFDHTCEFQAPFEGWFIPGGNGFDEIEQPNKWRPIIENKYA